MTGHVVRISGYGEKHQGDVIYRVIIQPDRLDARLRWNMTASAAISPSATSRSIHDADGTSARGLLDENF